MLNPKTENENKRIASISIPVHTLFIMKLIAQVKIPFFLNLRYMSEKLSVKVGIGNRGTE